MANEMKIQIGADVSSAVQGLNQVAAAADNNSDSVNKLSISWTQFVSQRMGPYMKELGSHGAAIRKIGEEWRLYKSGVEQIPPALIKTTNTTNQSAQALINLSRVAQDAPYGFIGIANNLNPLLESFQRLKQTTGSTGGALQALKAGLTGPAGIGLALGVVSSLIVSFGDKIFGSTRHISSMELAFAQLSIAINNIGKDLDTLRKNLDFSVEIQKLQLQLSGLTGKKLDIAGIQAEIDANTKFIEQATGQFSKLDKLKSVFDGYKKAIISGGDVIKQVGGKEGALSQILRNFSDVTQVPEGLLSKLSAKETARLKQYQQLLKQQAEIKGKIDDAFRKNLLLSTQIGVKNLPDIKTDKAVLNPKELEIKPDKLKINTKESAREINNLSEREIIPAGGSPVQRVINLAPIQKAAEMIKDLRTKNQKAMMEAASLLSSVLTPAFDAFFSAVQKGENVFKAFGQAVVNALTQMIAKLAATAAISGILSGLGFGSFSTIFSMLSHRAGGGPVSGGTPYIVGEKGPEIFMPANSGKIIPSGSGRFQSGNLGGLIGQVNFQISGNNLVGVLSNANRSQRRLV